MTFHNMQPLWTVFRPSHCHLDYNSYLVGITMRCYSRSQMMRWTQLLVAFAITTVAHAAAASVTVTINQPGAGAPVGDSLVVSAAIYSDPYAVSTARATVGSIMAPLSTAGQGTIDISSLPIGSTTLT